MLCACSWGKIEPEEHEHVFERDLDSASKGQSWALTLFFQVCSLLNFSSGMAQMLIFWISRFAHSSIIPKKTSCFLLLTSA